MVEVSDTIECKSRVSSGKGGARKLRKDGMVPAVAYGPGSEPRHLTVDPHTFQQQRERYGLSHIYDVVVDGKERFKALIKTLQRDAVDRAVQHVDFYEVDMNKPIRVSVRIELTGKPAGAIDGGMLSQELRRVEITALPDKVPEKLTHDISPMALGAILHLSDLVLPEGVKFTTAHDEAVARVVAPEAEAATPAAAEAGAAAAATPASEESKA